MLRHATSAVALLLALWLLVGQPVSGVLRRRRPVPLLRRYRDSVVRQWALVAVAALVTLVGVGAPPHALGLVPTWARELRWVEEVGTAVVLGLLVVVALRLDARRRPGRSLLDRLLRPVAHLLPRSRRERRAYAVVAVTAGVTEEVLYRAWLPWFLVLAAPVGDSRGAYLVAAAAFGLGHAYQGLPAVLLTGAVGYGLGVIALTTGSVLVPVVLHVLVDLRLLLLVPRERSRGRAEHVQLGLQA